MSLTTKILEDLMKDKRTYEIKQSIQENFAETKTRWVRHQDIQNIDKE